MNKQWALLEEIGNVHYVLEKGKELKTDRVGNSGKESLNLEGKKGQRRKQKSD